MFLHSTSWEVTFFEAAEWPVPPLPLSQADSLNIEAIVWSITPLMDQELR